MTRLASVILALTIASSVSAGVRKAEPAVAPVVNVNTATEQQYAFLPGVGPKLAAELNAHVESCCDHQEGARAAFKSVNDLLKVKGIGPAKLAKMRPYVVLKGETTAKGKIRAAKEAAK